VKDIEEQPNQFATELDKEAIILDLMDRLHIDGTEVPGHKMATNRRRKLRFIKQKNGGMFVAEE
jgi:hypothetical protein